MKSHESILLNIFRRACCSMSTSSFFGDGIISGVHAVQITIPRTEFLHLAEVEVFGPITRSSPTTYERIPNVAKCPVGKGLNDAIECKWAGLSRGVGGIIRPLANGDPGTVINRGYNSDTPCGCYLAGHNDQAIRFEDPVGGICTR
jgi:hypothetical protein